MNHTKKFDTLPDKQNKNQLLNYPEFPIPMKGNLNNRMKSDFIKRIIHKNNT